MNAQKLHPYARISPHSQETIELFEAMLENAPLLKPILFLGFSPRCVRVGGIKRDEHELKRIVAGFTNRLARRTDQALFPLMWFAGVEETVDDPRLHTHSVVLGERGIEPRIAYELQPREKITRRDGRAYYRKLGKLEAQPYVPGLGGIAYSVNHHFPLKFESLFYPHGKSERRKERFEPFTDHLRTAYRLLNEQAFM